MDIDEAIIVNVVAVPANQQKMIRLPLQKQETKIHMIFAINDESDEVPDYFVGDGPQCVICEFVMTKLEAELKDKKTEVRRFQVLKFLQY